MDTKKCPHCGVIRPMDEFALNKSKRDGRASICKECVRQKARQNKDKNNEASRRWRREHKERALATQRAWREKNADAIREYKRRWAEEHRDTLNRSSLEAYYANKDRRLEVQREYRKRRRKRDVSYRIRESLTNCIKADIYRAFDAVKQSASIPRSLSRYLGCSLLEFVKHIEMQFTDGMSWDRLSDIHIDHYVPRAFFDHTIPAQVKVCWNYRNLRPMWAKDNLRKADTLPPDYMEHIRWVASELNISWDW